MLFSPHRDEYLIRFCISSRLCVNSEGLLVPATVDESVVICHSGAVFIYQVAQVPRAQSADERPLVTLVPPLDNKGRVGSLHPPMSVTLEEQVFFSEKLHAHLLN